MDTDSLTIARWQFRLAWGLAVDVHLRRLTDDACLWLPHHDSWTVRDDGTGRWVADWAEPEPTNAPPPSIGWLTWHMLWWWSDALSIVIGGRTGRREEVYWPGTARDTVTRLRDLASRWEMAMADLGQDSLTRPTAFPWPDERPLIYTISWVSLELMKNIAEIGEIVNMYTNRPTD